MLFQVVGPCHPRPPRQHLTPKWAHPQAEPAGGMLGPWPGNHSEEAMNSARKEEHRPPEDWALGVPSLEDQVGLPSSGWGPTGWLWVLCLRAPHGEIGRTLGLPGPRAGPAVAPE